MKTEITSDYLASQGLSPTFEERFWQKVIVVTYDRGCWLWFGCCYKNGYGIIGRWRESDSPISAHRASWILHYGPIPPDMNVCHRCDIRNCVRPDHLFIGSQKQNIQDAISKHRTHIGEANANAILDTPKVQAIRKLLGVGSSKKDISTLFGVSPTTIRAIEIRKIWDHVA